ncbi:MAG TPA: MaoC family dehydratase [Stellaceae bacterium]|nr:MaoC family dehydratase [Stellaceae bacterium]
MTDRPLYFEDYPVGAVFEGGRVEISEADILDFARRWDPQAMHVDKAAATAGQFGGLIASGWHTGAIMMRLLTEVFISPACNLASPGLDELRWIRPVRPGDILRLKVTVLEARHSRSKPDQGIIISLVEVLNQRSEPVMSLKPISLMRCRPD